MRTTRSSGYGPLRAGGSCSVSQRGRWRRHRRRRLDGWWRHRRRQRPRRVARVLRPGDDEASTRVLPPRRNSAREQVGLNVCRQVRPGSGLPAALEFGQGLRLGSHVGHWVRCIVGWRGRWQTVTGHPVGDIASAIVSSTNKSLYGCRRRRRRCVMAARAQDVGRRRRCRTRTAHDWHASRLHGRRRYSR